MKMSEEIREMINENIVHFATASRDGKPNVVPVGAIRAIGDSKLLIVDVLFDKTEKNLLENPQVALAVEVLGRGHHVDTSSRDERPSSRVVSSSRGQKK